MLTPQQTGALPNAGMQSIFAALRAPVHVNFQFQDYIAKLIGVDPGKLLFFYLDAAWLNKGRCPGGRPSVSEHKG